jgi:hypothetical protein
VRPAKVAYCVNCIMPNGFSMHRHRTLCILPNGSCVHTKGWVLWMLLPVTKADCIFGWIWRWRGASFNVVPLPLPPPFSPTRYAYCVIHILSRSCKLCPIKQEMYRSKCGLLHRFS